MGQSTEIISGLIGEPSWITVVAPAGEERAETRSSEREAASFEFFSWSLGPAISRVPEVVCTAAEIRTPPECVHKFVAAAANISAVRCIVVEEAPHQVVHVTTFVSPATEDVREAIYALEIDTIRKNPNLSFDFHVRSTEEASGSGLAPGSANYYFAVWGSVDGDQGRASPDG